MKLALDLDDVLCDFVGTWCQWLFTKGYTENLLSRTDIDCYDYFYKNFGEKAHDFFLVEPSNLYENMVTPFSGSHEFIGWAKTKFDDITIITHCEQPDAQEAKTRFVRDNYDIHNVKFSGRKEKYEFIDKDTILVDDYPHNVLKHIGQNNGHGICFNRNGANGWDGLNKYLYITNNLPVDLKKYWDKVESYAHLQIILQEIKGGESYE